MPSAARTAGGSSSGNTELHRQRANYDAQAPLADRLLCPLGTRLYQRQYAALYDFRLRILRKRVQQRAAARWADLAAAERVHSQLRSESQSQLELGDDQDADEGDGEDGEDGDVEMDDGAEEGDASGGAEASQASTSGLASTAEGGGALEPPKHVPRILDINPGEVCYIIGTVYCAMPLKPDVLEDLTREQWLPPQPLRDKYVDTERDQLYLEDESGRIRLVGEPLKWGHGAKLRNMCVTGVVVAVLGTETRHGDFTVADIVFPSLPPSSGPAPDPPRPAKKDEDDEDEAMAADGERDRWIVLVSGLDLSPSSTSDTDVVDSSVAKMESDGGVVAPAEQANGHAGPSVTGSITPEVRAQLLTEWLTGELGDDDERRAVTDIVGLVVAGNSMAKPIRIDEERKLRKFGGPAASGPNARPTLALDQFLTDIAATMDVVVLPGERDPTSLALPQQPIHFALLPRASRFASCRRVTNPAWFGLGGRRILGTGGQNVDDIYKYAEEGDEGRVQMAARTLDWGHVAPTAPDTLWCYPYNTDDPFLIRDAPDVYFVGNQPAFGTMLYQTSEGHKTRIVLVPRFSQTGNVVLVNLRTLACELVNIGSAI